MARVRTLYPSNARPKVRPRRRRVGSLARLQRQEPAGPHRGLRCPPGTYFSSRSLRSNPSDLEENAVLDHQVRPRHQAQPHTRHLPASRGRTIGLADCIPRISPQPLWCVLVSHRRPAEPQAKSQPLRIEDCDVRRGRTSPPDDCVQTPVTWRKTQSSITKYVPVPEGASSRTDSRENSFPSHLSKAVGGDTPPNEMCPTTHLRHLVSHPASP